MRLPKGITELSTRAFIHSKLTHIDLDSTVLEIGDYCFDACHFLESVTMTNSVVTIKPYAFMCCRLLKKVSLSNSLRCIQEGTFFCCESLEGIDIPEGVSKICQYAFRECYVLRTIRLPKTLKAIYNEAFWRVLFIKNCYYNGTKEQFLKVLRLNDYLYIPIKAMDGEIEWKIKEAFFAF